MSDCFQLVLDGDTISFTPDGRIHVLDAIGALSGSDKERSQGIWKALKTQNSELDGCCRKHRFAGGDISPAANPEEWEVIEKMLFQHIVSEGIDASSKPDDTVFS